MAKKKDKWVVPPGWEHHANPGQSWTPDDEAHFQEGVTREEVIIMNSKRVFCKTCGSEYSKSLRYCPGCADKAKIGVAIFLMFLLSVFKGFRI
jgi:hypothetical protein